MEALKRQDRLRFLETLLIINGMMQVGSTIAAAVSGQSASGGDSLRKLLAEYKAEMFPELAIELEEKAQRAKELVKREIARGPLKVRPTTQPKLRRRQGAGSAVRPKLKRR